MSDSKELLRFTTLHNDAIIPTKAHPSDAGFDFAVYQDVILEPGINKVPTGIACALPEGTYGRLAMRSSLGARYGLILTGGVIDSNYRGEIGILIVNPGTKPITIKKGDRIAQMIVEYVVDVNVQVFYGCTFDMNTDRGTGGFGSTGN